MVSLVCRRLATVRVDFHMVPGGDLVGGWVGSGDTMDLISFRFADSHETQTTTKDGDHPRVEKSTHACVLTLETNWSMLGT